MLLHTYSLSQISIKIERELSNKIVLHCNRNRTISVNRRNSRSSCRHRARPPDSLTFYPWKFRGAYHTQLDIILTFLGQIGVVPSAEEVLLIPLALAVANHHDPVLGHVFSYFLLRVISLDVDRPLSTLRLYEIVLGRKIDESRTTADAGDEGRKALRSISPLSPPYSRISRDGLAQLREFGRV